MNQFHFKGLIDTTLRDGQQSPLLFDTNTYRFTLEDKKTLINGLVKLGIRFFEFFSPVVSETEKNDFIELKSFIKTITDEKIILMAHCRCHSDDVEQAISIGFNGLNLYMGVSKIAQNYSHNYSFTEILELTKSIISNLRKKYPELYIRFSVEDTFRTPLSDVFQVYDQLHTYVNTFGMPDTVGVATPILVAKRVDALKKRYPHVNLECHFHNDRGYSLINAVTAIEHGVSYIDTSLWGLAERSGITSTTGLLLNLLFTDKKLVKNYNLNLCYPLNVLMGSILKAQVPYTEPVSLTNRTHTAGVHQKAILNNKKVYEAHNLEQFGVSNNQVLLGPLSGWNLIYYYLKEVDN
ncbi:MAG: LeuA family protein, partial [bacterium]|nr:LeuA family protein [bacterium]